MTICEMYEMACTKITAVLPEGFEIDCSGYDDDLLVVRVYDYRDRGSAHYGEQYDRFYYRPAEDEWTGKVDYWFKRKLADFVDRWEV